LQGWLPVSLFRETGIHIIMKNDQPQKNKIDGERTADRQPFSERGVTTVIGIVVFYFIIFWVVLPLFLVGTGLRLDYLRPFRLPQTLLVTLGGWTFLLFGLAILFVSMWQLWRQGKGPPISHLPPTQFVASGLYRYVRHPIYVGYTLAFAGVALVIDSFWSFVFCVPLLIAGWVVYVLYYEEPMLVDRFGDTYRVYARQVRLLWPVTRAEKKPGEAGVFLSKTYAGLNRLANRTVLIRKGSFILVTYGVFCAIGGFVLVHSTAVLLIQQGIGHAEAGLFLVGITLFTCFFAWFFWWLMRWRTMITRPLWGLNQNGFVSYGGLAGVMLFAVIFSFQYGHHVLMLTDVLMQGIFFAYAIGRFGCLTYGCCCGMRTQKPLGIEYVHPDAKVIRLGGTSGVRRYPVQVFDSVHGLVAALIICLLVSATVPVGFVSAFSLMLFGIGRTFTEAYREREHPVFGRFTYGQLGAWITVLSGWIMLLFLKPDMDQHTPGIWSFGAIMESLSLMPVVLLSTLIILLVFGVHWRHVGTWGGEKMGRV